MLSKRRCHDTDDDDDGVDDIDADADANDINDNDVDAHVNVPAKITLPPHSGRTQLMRPNSNGKMLTP